MEQDGYRHAYAEGEAQRAILAGEISEVQRKATAEMRLWELYDAVVKAHAEGDAKAEAKAQKRLNTAKAKARKELMSMVANIE